MSAPLPASQNQKEDPQRRATNIAVALGSLLLLAILACHIALEIKNPSLGKLVRNAFEYLSLALISGLVSLFLFKNVIRIQNNDSRKRLLQRSCLYASAGVLGAIAAWALVVHVCFGCHLVKKVTWDKNVEDIQTKATTANQTVVPNDKDTASHWKLTVAELLQTYSAVLIGLLAVIAIWLQLQDIRGQQQEFRASVALNLTMQEMEIIRRSLDTILPPGLKHGCRLDPVDYRTLIERYTDDCRKRGGIEDTEFISAAKIYIEKLETKKVHLVKLEDEVNARREGK